ncbi:methylmalonyl-CoA mutase family protein [Litoribacter populi]|uniref:methylmalonyl-CoA mutase family protein n=1 Tax=Litoribacter populi TaxID=2598460 RepID=UPI00117DEB9A|nr:methylmalonyl-CoA mutase family protein [Litoribacter populi]
MTKLFEEFSPVSKQEWIEQATKDLKGEDFEKKLITRAIEGFSVFPFYTQDDLGGVEWLKAYQNKLNTPSEIPGMSPRIWGNVASIDTTDVTKANNEIKAVLENGADALVLEINSEVDFKALLKDVLPQYIQIWLKLSRLDSAIIKAFIDWFESKGLRSAELSGGVIANDFEQIVSLKGGKEAYFSSVGESFKLTLSYPNFKGICIDASLYHNSGGHAVEEIGFGLSQTIDVLDELTNAGADVSSVFDNMFLRVSSGVNYFMEIAKFRTFRVAMHKLAGLYAVELDPASFQIFAETSLWAQSPIDPYNNLLRNTTASMSAILGGCNALQIHSHNLSLQQPDNFSKRMARNISNILKEESYFDKVLDPVAGSYYLENLTSTLFAESMKLVKQTEENGGWWASLEKGIVQTAVKETRKTKFASLSNRKQVMVGVNQYVNQAEKVNFDFPEIEETEKELKSFSFCYPIVQMRKRVQKAFANSNSHLKVEVLPLGGNPKPRVGFTQGFFEAAGFELSVADTSLDASTAIEKAKNSDARFIVFAGADEDYEHMTAEIAKAMRQESKILVLAGYPAAQIETLLSSGIQHYIHLKTDLIATIDQLLDEAQL